jgi:hypothetical protein
VTATLTFHHSATGPASTSRTASRCSSISRHSQPGVILLRNGQSIPLVGIADKAAA